MGDTPETTAAFRVLPAVVLVWIAAAAVLVLARWQTLLAEGPADADSIMRLVQVRDFIAGQPWFDTVQRRLGFPEGTSLHWSRFIDAPLAGLVLGFEALVQSRWLAEMLAAAAWPLLLLVVFIAATASVADAIGGRAAAILAALISVQPGPAINLFLPGVIDHHNLQVTLSLLFAACILRADRTAAAAAGAGVAAALMLAIGTETLPVLAAGTAIVTLAWLFEPERFASAARTYGLSLALATLACLAATVEPDRWLSGACDALSATYAALAVTGGVGLAVFATLIRAPGALARRFQALALLAAICVGMILIYFPDCLAGPLGAIDPRTRAIWYDQILETQDISRFLATRFATGVSILAVPLIALLTCLWFLTTAPAEHRYRWAAAALLIGVAVFSMVLQIRAAALAAALAAPIMAVLVVRIARFARGKQGGLSLPVIVCLLPFVCFVGWYALADAVQRPLASRLGLVLSSPRHAVTEECLQKSAWTELAALPPATALVQTGLAPSLLAYTPHRAVAGNYHRGAAGIIDTYAALTATGGKAREILARRGARYIVLCHGGDAGVSGDPQFVNGLLGRLKRGEVPAWLEPVFAGDRLLAYRVRQS